MVLSQTDGRGGGVGQHTCIGFTVWWRTHVTHHTSYVTHVTRHTSHVTRHTSQIWRCKPGAAPQRVWSSGVVTGCVRARGGNSWVAPSLVGEAGVSEGREVSVTLRMEGLVLYYIVPHTLLPGVQVRRGRGGFEYVV